MMARRLGCVFLMSLAAAASSFAQGSPTGTISGRVTTATGALPGVTVTTTSPALQGNRVAISSDNGDFILPLLPPGTYRVTFELQGFRTAEHSANVGAGQTVPLDVGLTVAGAAETVTVTGKLENFAQLATVSTSYKAADIAALPSDRTLNATVLLAPGVSNTGPSTNSQDSSTQAITIAGAMSFENLFLVNGVVLNENLRGQGVPLFIEDAIQETTVTSGAVSAEFGRFSGGLVNAVTKSGGNSFSGSFRTTLTNDSWRELTPYPNDTKVDDVVPTYEFTAGGPIARDRLWFFGAGRIVDRVEARQTTTTNIPYTLEEAERRYEGKLTFSLSPNHTVRGSYIYRNRDQINTSSFTILDTAQPLQPHPSRTICDRSTTQGSCRPTCSWRHRREPQPEVRQQRRLDHGHHRRHAGDRPGAKLALLVADVLRRVRAGRGAQQRERGASRGPGSRRPARPARTTSCSATTRSTTSGSPRTISRAATTASSARPRSSAAARSTRAGHPGARP